MQFLRNSKFLLALLCIETAFLLYLVKETDLFSEANIKVAPGKTYSLLVDDERLPIPARAGQTLIIKVVNKTKNLLDLPAGRTVINFEDDQKAMAKINRSRFMFVYDKPENLRDLFTQEKLGTLKQETDWATIQTVLHWARQQFPPGTPKTYPTQNAAKLLPLLRNGTEEGFCAQYAYVLVQALQAMGYVARHITIEGHEVTEAWVPSLKKWVCLDPTSDAYFENKKGTKLSALEIHREKEIVVKSSLTKESGDNFKRRYNTLYFWLSNDVVTNPVNIYDLGKYRVRAIFNPEELKEVTPGDLFTVTPDELYGPPSFCNGSRL